MKGFKQCEKNHFYKEDLDECPYCPGGTVADAQDGTKTAILGNDDNSTKTVVFGNQKSENIDTPKKILTLQEPLLHLAKVLMILKNQMRFKFLKES